MGKIICDVCGTTYQDTALRCPICGCTRDEAADMLGDELMMDELLTETRNNRPVKKREIFDFDEADSGVSSAEAESESYDDEFEEAPRQNTALIVLLTVLIALLLIGAAFLFFRFYLPGLESKDKPLETMPPYTEPTVIQTLPTETTEPTIPCESLALLSGHATEEAELVNPGQKFLINVRVLPENTTDKVQYVSADESVATVSEDGQVVAVGEGETVINIICGQIEMPCMVSCNFSKETEPPTEETAAPTEETAKPLADVTLKLKKTDIRLKVYYQFQLELDCDLEQTDVEWSSEHPHIAKVDEEGNVTAVKSGTTSVTAKYGDQEVSCMIRCFE